MVQGLTVLEITTLAVVAAGFFFLIVGACGTLWPRRTRSGDVLEVELPWHIKVKSNVIAIGIILVGVGLLAGAVWTSLQIVPKFSLLGKVALHDGRTFSGISVGLIPPGHYTVTAADGTFRLEVPTLKKNEYGQYQAIVYYRDRDGLRFDIAKVSLERDYSASVDHRFPRGR